LANNLYNLAKKWRTDFLAGNRFIMRLLQSTMLWNSGVQEQSNNNLFKEIFGQEKAVDVKLAVDLLGCAEIYDAAIIVAGDGDYVTAVQAVKNRGKQVVDVSFETRGGKLLPGGARSLNQITDKHLIVKYAQMKDFMFPPHNQSGFS